MIGRLFRQSTCMPVFFLYIRDAIYIRPPTHDLKQTHYVLQYMPFMFPVLFHHCNDINRPQSLLFWLWFVPETAISYEYLMQTTTFLQSFVTVCTFNAPDDDDQNTKHHIICQWTQKQIHDLFLYSFNVLYRFTARCPQMYKKNYATHVF